LDNNQVIDSQFASSDNFHPQGCLFGDECGSSYIADTFIQNFSTSAIPEPSSATFIVEISVMAGIRRYRLK